MRATDAVLPTSRAVAAGSSPRRTFAGQSFDKIELSCIRREPKDIGPEANEAARAAGLLPGMLWARGRGSHLDGAKVPIWVRAEDIAREMNARPDNFTNTPVRLLLDGESDDAVDAVCFRVRSNVLSDEPTTVDFLPIPEGGRGIRIRMPVKLINHERCLAYKQGGWPLQLVYHIPVIVNTQRIPSHIVADIRGKQIGDMVRLGDAVLGDGIHPAPGQEAHLPLVKFLGTKRGDAR